MKLEQLEKLLDERLKKEIAQEWDNVGLLIGRREKEVQRILLALELTPSILDEAVAKKCDALLVHHPLIFSGVKKIVSDDGDNLIYRLIQEDIGLYVAHTNFDSIESGLNDYFARLLNAKEIEIQSEDEKDVFLRLFTVEEQKLSDLVDTIKKKFSLTTIRKIGHTDKVRKVGVVTGAGGDYAFLSKKHGAEVFITGDIKYHQAMEFKEKGLCVLDVGHFETEKIFSHAMQHFIQTHLSELKSLEIILSEKEQGPFEWM